MYVVVTVAVAVGWILKLEHMYTTTYPEADSQNGYLRSTVRINGTTYRRPLRCGRRTRVFFYFISIQSGRLPRDLYTALGEI